MEAAQQRRMSQHTPIEESLRCETTESDWSRDLSNPQDGPMSEGSSSRRSTQDFELLRGDLVSYLSDKFDLPVELMRTRLGEWLLQRYACTGPSRVASHGGGWASATERRTKPDAEALTGEASTADARSDQLSCERASDARVR
jgi:hypothetical protein